MESEYSPIQVSKSRNLELDKSSQRATQVSLCTEMQRYETQHVQRIAKCRNGSFEPNTVATEWRVIESNAASNRVGEVVAEHLKEKLVRKKINWAGQKKERRGLRHIC